jgi:hypothetical protein
VGSAHKILQFQCNLQEIYFELVGISAGYHLRLESMNDYKSGNGIPIAVNNFDSDKQIKNNTFQFSYDPIYKRFIRELRDTDNREYIIDKYYLAMKHVKEQYKE